jgi:hypothetical protein
VNMVDRPVVLILFKTSVHAVVWVAQKVLCDRVAPALRDRLFELIVPHNRAHRHHTTQIRELHAVLGQVAVVGTD